MKQNAIIALMSFLAPVAIAATVTLAWNRSISPSIGRQTLYYGASGVGNYTNVVLLSPLLTQYQVLNLTTGATYHFAISATDTNTGLESDRSGEAVYTVPIPPSPPLAPTNLHVIGP